MADVVGFITDRLKAGDALLLAVDKAKAKFAELDDDPDEGPLLWMAIAHAQWKWGAVDAITLARVRQDIETGRGLDRWRDDGKTLSQRQVALNAFLARIESPNPKPSAIPKLVVRRAPFRAGDCLAVALQNGHYAAALVLAEDNSNREYGKNLVAMLDYDQACPPTVEVFERRPWLLRVQTPQRRERDVCWYLPVKFKSVSKRLSVVGTVPLKLGDPKPDKLYPHAGWLGFGEHVSEARERLALHPPPPLRDWFGWWPWRQR
ncbi:MAG: hypothetical protein JNL19_16580 [Burkholderiales bacterium]|nr:hypothetical protein [Burkholderiales bacterium]